MYWPRAVPFRRVHSVLLLLYVCMLCLCSGAGQHENKTNTTVEASGDDDTRNTMVVAFCLHIVHVVLRPAA